MKLAVALLLLVLASANPDAQRQHTSRAMRSLHDQIQAKGEQVAFRQLHRDVPVAVATTPTIATPTAVVAAPGLAVPTPTVAVPVTTTVAAAPGVLPVAVGTSATPVVATTTTPTVATTAVAPAPGTPAVATIPGTTTTTTTANPFVAAPVAVPPAVAATTVAHHEEHGSSEKDLFTLVTPTRALDDDPKGHPCRKAPRLYVPTTKYGKHLEETINQIKDQQDLGDCDEMAEFERAHHHRRGHKKGPAIDVVVNEQQGIEIAVGGEHDRSQRHPIHAEEAHRKIQQLLERVRSLEGDNEDHYRHRRRRSHEEHEEHAAAPVTPAVATPSPAVAATPTPTDAAAATPAPAAAGVALPTISVSAIAPSNGATPGATPVAVAGSPATTAATPAAPAGVPAGSVPAGASVPAPATTTTAATTTTTATPHFAQVQSTEEGHAQSHMYNGQRHSHRHAVQHNGPKAMPVQHTSAEIAEHEKLMRARHERTAAKAKAAHSDNEHATRKPEALPVRFHAPDGTELHGGAPPTPHPQQYAPRPTHNQFGRRQGQQE